MGSKRKSSREYELIMSCGDTLFEVLIRVPVKILFRFKVVSKQWLSMISDPSFDRSNGLLLFGPAMENHTKGPIYSYDIYNPMTGQGITLPPVPRHSFQFQIFTGFVTQIKDNVLESFRVLRIVAGYKSFHRSFRYEVYFSEIREWVWYIVDFDQNMYFDHMWDNCVEIEKILHGIVRGHIMAFDLYNNPDSVRLISLPFDSTLACEGDEIGEYMLFSDQGHLRYLELLRGRSDREFSLSLWELIDYDSGEWCLQHKVILDKFRCDGDGSKYLRQLCFNPFGSNVVYMLYKERASQYLMSYDINTRELKTMDETMDDSSKNVLSRIPFLLQLFLFVIPPWPVLVNYEIMLPPKTN
ncbi:putative F-box/kelch-repeat protein At1g15680 [Henckelia pumila]|uniref:putative F-box/kelch-repeat protein At1g15680 n=1 Tax=Henckelia pumila TaxID=405737 RepID=UPI003C6E1D3A